MMFYNINGTTSYNAGQMSANVSSDAASENISASVGTQSGQTQTSGTTQAGLQVLQNMLAGEVFTGEVTAMNGNTVTLTMGNGVSIPATLLANAQVQLGQNVTFQINENTGTQISIRPMETDAQQAELINRVLDSSDLPATDKNIAIVNELLTQKMAVNNETVLGLVRNAVKFPEAGVDTLVRLTKLDIPVTQENITQFEAYKNYEHSITGELTQTGSDLSQLMSELAQNKGSDGVLSFTSQLQNIFYPENESLVKTEDGSVSVKNDTENAQNIADNAKNAGSEPITTSIPQAEREQLLNSLTDTFGKEAVSKFGEQLKNGTMTVGELLKNINELLKENPSLNNEQLSDLFSSKEMEQLTKALVRDRMMINPQTLKEEEGIQEFYKNLKENINRLSQAVSDADTTKSTNLSKNLDTIKNNVEFMNDLNRNMTYIQLPVKFSQSNANGELYVFTDKKKLAQKKDNISALLHLDMDHLGPIDIYVKLAGKNVSTNFCLESEEMLDFVEQHIEQLNQRLEDMGYQVKFEGKVQDKENGKVDFVEDFLDRDTDRKPITQYLFDRKA